MKNKTLASLELAIVFCLLFFVALPSTASATEDETLDIYGNANEDDIIDMRDLTITARMILRLEDETELADANYDGRVSVADMTQIGLIILGRESKLTFIDGTDRIVTVNKPIARIVCGSSDNAEIVKLLGAADRVVGVDLFTTTEKTIFPELSELPVVGEHMFLDYETVFELDPDLFIACTPWSMYPEFEDMLDKLDPEIPVICLSFLEPAPLVEDIRKLRYILNTEEKGEEFIAFYEGVVNDITEKTAGLSEEDKPRVFYEMYSDYQTLSDDLVLYSSHIAMAGGINIAADLPGYGFEVEPEWVADQDPDVITRIAYPKTGYPGVPKTACGYDADDPAEMKALRDSIMNRDELAGGKAVTSGRVYVRHYYLQDTPHFFIGVAYLAKWFHPTLFSDLDPKAIHQEYLTDFLHIDYDLDEHGVFVYHPVEHPDGK